jgi:hypothetical protein
VAKEVLAPKAIVSNMGIPYFEGEKSLKRQTGKGIDVHEKYKVIVTSSLVYYLYY